MAGKLVVLDGADGCGKSTQTNRLVKKLEEAGEKVLLISYPDYDEPSSALVRLYLSGEISSNMNEVNPYAASSFYSADRYISYLTHWKKYYDAGYLIIASRYTTSNAIHQMGKLPSSQWDEFLAWLFSYEYHHLQLPTPNLVIYLNMEREAADDLILSRYDGDESCKDIHEKDPTYLDKCRICAEYVAQKQGWDMVTCSLHGRPLSIEEIGDKIEKILKKIK